MIAETLGQATDQTRPFLNLSQKQHSCSDVIFPPSNRAFTFR